MRTLAPIISIATLTVSSGLHASPSRPARVNHVPVLTVDPKALTNEIVVSSRPPTEGWAITETINEPAVAVVTDGLVRGTTGNEADARRMNQDWERQSKIDAHLRR